MKKHFLKNISLFLLAGVSLSIFPMTAFAEEVSKIPTTLETPKLPNINFTKPENMPDINVDLSTEYQTLIKDLESKGFGKVTVQEEGLNTEWSSQGSKDKLSSEEFSKYLTNIESKYAEQIEAAKKASSGISYEKLDLKGKWDLMSYNDAKNQSTKLPDYNTLKNNLQSSVQAVTPSKPSQSLSYTPPKEFNDIKNSVINGTKLPNLGNYSNLPDGFTINADGTFNDNRTLQGIPSLIGGTVGNIISDAPNILNGFIDGFNKGENGGSSSGKYDSIINRQEWMEEEINKIH